MKTNNISDDKNGETTILLYQYFHPDDVISARLFSELGLRLTALENHSVTAIPSTRACHDPSKSFPRKETWQGIEIRRISRPRWRQASNSGRLGNAILMLLGWTWQSMTLRSSKHEVMIVGSDPILGVLIAIPWRLFRPNAKIVHWCHDLYPAAAVADGLVSSKSWLVRSLRFVLRSAYRRCDAIVDLGQCMQESLLKECDHPTIRTTITPWALVEPKATPQADGDTRNALFGNASLGLLYSGNLGRAHLYKPFLKLAKRLEQDSPSDHPLCHLCFSGRGPRIEQLRKDVGETRCNVGFAGFAPEGELEKRLAAADIHLVSLQSNWTGTVVPSKFFGALAAGRPVLFAGSNDSAIAKWIQEYDVGWVLNEDTLDKVESELRLLAGNAPTLDTLKKRCFETYHREFSREKQLEKWVKLLSELQSEVNHAKSTT